MNETITIVGNLVEDPRQIETSSGVPITSFRVACARRHLDRSRGEWVDDGTNYYGVSTFRSLAVNALTSLRRGQRVIVTGRLKLREWDTGTKKGVSADIDAQAVGHDLLWGTSSFNKTIGTRSAETATDAGGPAPVDAQPEHGVDEAPSGFQEDAWAVPNQTWDTVPVTH